MAGYIYGIEFNNGTVKVGKTSDVGSRLYAHQHHAKAVGVGVIMFLVSTYIENDGKTETDLIEMMGTKYKKFGSEYFNGANIQSVMDLLDDLDIGYFLTDVIKKMTINGEKSYMMAPNTPMGVQSSGPIRKSIEEKVEKLLNGRELSFGVLANMIRNRRGVKDEIEKMIASGKIKVREKQNPSTKVVYRMLSLS